jgi:predicted ester cyclase
VPHFSSSAETKRRKAFGRRVAICKAFPVEYEIIIGRRAKKTVDGRDHHHVHSTHKGEFLGVAPTGRKIHFDTVDAMRVHNGKITEHWGVANLFSLMQLLGAFAPDKKSYA